MIDFQSSAEDQKLQQDFDCPSAIFFVISASICTFKKHKTWKPELIVKIVKFRNRLPVLLVVFMFQVLAPGLTRGQGSWYWNSSLNSEASLLSGVVVAGESGIASIYYNPANITEMNYSNLSLSANLFTFTIFNAENALGTDFPADRLQFSVQPRIITLTLRPKKKPDLFIEIAYYTRNKYYYLINQGSSANLDLIPSNPGDESYSADFYYRWSNQNLHGGAGIGYKISESLSLGYSLLVSYTDDQFYNLVTANAFVMPPAPSASQGQLLASTMYQLNYSLYDVRLLNKLGLHWKRNNWSLGFNITPPSLKLFGDGKVIKQYTYSNIHKDPESDEVSSAYSGGRQKKCISHFKDPFSVAAGINYHASSGKTILLFNAEYFFGIPTYTYIEARTDPGEYGYDFTSGDPKEWLSFASNHKPVLNLGIAIKQRISRDLMLSGGYRTDFNYLSPIKDAEFQNYNTRRIYSFDIYHATYGLSYSFTRGSLILGMQFSYGRKRNQDQIVNLTEPVEYIDESIIPLTGMINSNVDVKYNDILLYFSFVFNFLKDKAD